MTLNVNDDDEEGLGHFVQQRENLGGGTPPNPDAG